MDTCDVLIIGGGPAGSACAWKLTQAGLDVVVVDKATFPREKVCAGWITPQVIDVMQIDRDEYSQRRTFQPITGFRVGLIGRDDTIEVCYDRPVSFGIRRCEFDDYLLQRSRARLLLGAPVSSVRREGTRWVVNETISAPMLVGAGGHFCPVARLLNGRASHSRLVAAQEVEFAVGAPDVRAYRIAGETPELYFYPDLTGYGWCFRKGQHMNIGFGRLDRGALPKASAEFVSHLKARRRIPADVSWRWHGHAYLVAGSPARRAVDEAVMLIGDAAGLAYPHSGEGIRPAIESGLAAASAIVAAHGNYARQRLAMYERQVRTRFTAESLLSPFAGFVPARVSTALARRLLANRPFVRHVVLDRWFLSRSTPRPARGARARWI